MENNKFISNICNNKTEEFRHQTEKYLNNLSDRTKDINNFLTITEIEENLENLIGNATTTCLDMTSEFLSSLNEKKLIELKKKSMPFKG